MQTALVRIYKEHSGRVLAALIVQLRDFDLAEEALQDAVSEALRVWPDKGVPDNGGAWLLTVARRRAIDRIRRSGTRNSDSVRATLQQLLEDVELPETEFTVPDERLRLIFTCCHPALSPESQIALTLKTLCGLTAPEIARAFLTSEPTMNQRLTRAKTKIRAAGIPYAVPEKQDLGPRLQSVLAVIYLIYNESYAALSGPDLTRADLATEAVRLVEILRNLLPHPEVSGLLSLMILHNARRSSRTNDTGDIVTLEHQNRALWDHEAIEKGRRLLLHTLAARRPGPYQIQSAISALHCEAASWAATDWHQIVGLYGALMEMQPSPVVALNKAVAVANAGDLAQGVLDLSRLETQLPNYQPFFAAQAELLSRAGQRDAAKENYRRARELCQNDAERRFFDAKLHELG